MLAGAGRDDVDPADALADGRAYATWRAMIAAQGGDPDAPLPRARETDVITAPADGVLTRLDALAVGVAAWRLGAGRARREDAVQAGAGGHLVRSPRRPGPGWAALAAVTHRHPGTLCPRPGGTGWGGERRARP